MSSIIGGTRIQPTSRQSSQVRVSNWLLTASIAFGEVTGDARETAMKAARAMLIKVKRILTSYSEACESEECSVE